MKLYHTTISSYSSKTRLAFYEKDIYVELVHVDLFDQAAHQRFVDEVYPLGKVPILVLDDGYKIPESSIIIEYLDQTFDAEPRLIPVDPTLSRRARFYDRMADLYLNNTATTLFFQSQKPESERDQKAIARSEKTIDVVYRFLNQGLEQGPYLLGDIYSIGDVSALVPLFYLTKLRPYTEYPHVAAYVERLMQRPSAQKVVGEIRQAMTANV